MGLLLFIAPYRSQRFGQQRERHSDVDGVQCYRATRDNDTCGGARGEHESSIFVLLLCPTIKNAPLLTAQLPKCYAFDIFYAHGRPYIIAHHHTAAQTYHAPPTCPIDLCSLSGSVFSIGEILMCFSASCAPVPSILSCCPCRAVFPACSFAGFCGPDVVGSKIGRDDVDSNCSCVAFFGGMVLVMEIDMLEVTG